MASKTMMFVLGTMLATIVMVDAGPLSLSDEDAKLIMSYWRKWLPATATPVMIKKMLVAKTDLDATVNCGLGDKVHYDQFQAAADRERVKAFKQKEGQMFFLLNQTLEGSSVRIVWPETPKAVDAITFLPRHKADSIPFSSDKLPQIYKSLSISPESETAKAMKDSVESCERKDADEKSCPTSLEAMTSITKQDDARSTGMTRFDVVGIKKQAEYGRPMVACHIRAYPYAVFYCHRIKGTAAYKLALAGGNMRVEALAVCHADTSAWNADTLALKLLNVHPGSVSPICHFLENGNVLWVGK